MPGGVRIGKTGNCPYEAEVGCENCPFPDCRTNANGVLRQSLWTEEQRQKYELKYVYPEKEKEYKKSYYQRNREKILERVKKYDMEHKRKHRKKVEA